jgi:hypothetical protein
MVKPHFSNRRVSSFLILLLIVILWPLIGGASSEPISALDLDDSDPVEFSSRIMAIDYEEAMLVVAENTVLIVDMEIGGEQLTTKLTDPEEEAILLEALAPGQTVLVQGFKLDDGRVVASQVQLLEKLPLKVKTVRAIKPVQ